MVAGCTYWTDLHPCFFFFFFFFFLPLLHHFTVHVFLSLLQKKDKR